MGKALFFLFNVDSGTSLAKVFRKIEWEGMQESQGQDLGQRRVLWTWSLMNGFCLLWVSMDGVPSSAWWFTHQQEYSKQDSSPRASGNCTQWQELEEH